jgi:hypothetical protein
VNRRLRNGQIAQLPELSRDSLLPSVDGFSKLRHRF